MISHLFIYFVFGLFVACLSVYVSLDLNLSLGCRASKLIQGNDLN